MWGPTARAGPATGPADVRLRWAVLVASGLLLAIVGSKLLSPPSRSPLKIGFLVKMPEQAWFINEIKAAEAVGRTHDFEVIAIGTPDGERLMTAIDNLAAQGAAGFVACVPDVRLGPAVSAHARLAGLKVLTVDDQLVGADGKPLTEVPHLGMSGYKIGLQVGQSIAAEMKRRGWQPQDVGAIAITSNELPTAVQRVSGARDALLATGFLKANIFEAPQRATDTESASNATAPVLSRQPQLKQWVVFALNEESVLGGVRAAEQFGLGPDQVIGIGIGGTTTATAELSKSHATGFFGTVAVSSTMHGRQTASNLVAWIREGKRPPVLTETTGTLMTRDNWQRVKAELQL